MKTKISATGLFGILLLMGLAYFFLFFSLPVHQFLHNDDAIGGIAALHILQGEFPIFFYGQSYMGSLDFYLMAILFHIFGSSTFVLRISYLPLWIVFLLSLFLIAKHTSGRFGAKLAIAYALFPSYSIMVCIGRGGYSVMLALGTVLLYLPIQKHFIQGRPISKTLALMMGLLGGLIFWNDYLGLPYLVWGCFFLFISDFKGFFWPKAFLFLSGILLGSSPFWGWNIIHDYESLRTMGQFSGSVSAVLYGQRLTHLVEYSLPGLLGYGAYYLQGGDWLRRVIQICYGLLLSYVLLRQSRKESPNRWTVFSLFLFSFLVIGIFVRSNQTGAARYLLPIYSIMPILVSILVYDLFRIKATLGILMLIGLIILNLHDVFLIGRINTNAYNDAKQLSGFLEANHIRYAWTHSSYGHPISFLTREKTICADPGGFRIPQYSEMLEGRAESVALIASRNNFFNPQGARDILKALSARYHEQTFGEFSLFWPIDNPFSDVKRFSLKGVTVKGSSQVDPILAIDNNRSTRWHTNRPMKSGDWFLIDFQRPVQVNRIVLLPGDGNMDDHPRAFKVLVSMDGSHFKEVLNLPNYLDSTYWFNGIPKISLEGITEIVFPPQSYRFLKIELLEGTSDLFWSISELLAFEAESSPSVDHQDLELKSLITWLSFKGFQTVYTYDALSAKLFHYSKRKIRGHMSYKFLGEVTQDESFADSNKRTFLLVDSPVLILNQKDAIKITNILIKHRLPHKIQSIAGYTVVQILPFIGTIPPGSLPKYEASSNRKELPLLLDGRLETRWTTGQPQRDGGWLIIEPGKGFSADFIQLVVGESLQDFPRGLQVHGSIDGKGWQDLHDNLLPDRYYFFNGELIPSPRESLLDLRSIDKRFRYIKFSLTKAIEFDWWSVAEVKFFKAQ